MSLNKYKDMYKALPVGLYRTSLKDGTFLEANDLLVDMLGFKSIDDLRSNAKATDFYINPSNRIQLLTRLKKDKVVYDYELHLYSPKMGKDLWVVITARLNEKEGYLEGSLMNISKRKKSEAEVINKLQTIKEAANKRCLELDDYCSVSLPK